MCVSQWSPGTGTGHAVRMELGVSSPPCLLGCSPAAPNAVLSQRPLSCDGEDVFRVWMAKPGSIHEAVRQGVSHLPRALPRRHHVRSPADANLGRGFPKVLHKFEELATSLSALGRGGG